MKIHCTNADEDLQLSQLGMAVEIINHEFEANILTIRKNLRKLKAWSDVNPELESLYKNVRTSFDHLDSYLTLFTPLHRRLQRTATEISGKEIALFLKDLFSERFDRHGIKLIATDAFSRKKTTGYPSSYYPVFVNLVENAAFWLKNRSVKEITLDADDSSFIIRDTGTGITDRDREAVFEFGFSRKPNGKGMGLYISREVLRRIGNDLILSPKSSESGATFRIELNQNKE